MADFEFIEFYPDTWHQAQGLASQLSGWVFRGQQFSEWGLETSLERAFKRMGTTDSIEQIEIKILDRFMRRAHHYISAPPSRTDTLEWLSLIQHHGGPTRLLDFTRSFYVAAFFAVEQAESVSAIWCLNLNKLRDSSNNLIASSNIDENETTNIYNMLVTGKLDTPLAIHAEPYRQSERLVAQQGLFVAPCSLKTRMVNCLFGTLDNAVPHPMENITEYEMAHLELGTYPQVGRVVKIHLPRNIHPEARRNLRSMNIDAASLFPGLDGFTRSLFWPD